MEKKGRPGRLEKAARIRQIRMSKGLTQEAFAELLGVSLNAYKAVENGENNLSMEMLSKIRNNANVSSDYILYGDTGSFHEVWLEVNSCDDKSKLQIMVRLIDYFCNEKMPKVATKDFTFERMLKEIKTSDGDEG